MSDFKTNPNCRCARCRLRGMMAPAVLISLGVLFLLDNFGVRGFHDTWPLLLIVIGVVKVLQYTAPTDGHIPIGGYIPAPQAWTPPPPVAPGGQLPGSDTNAENQGVNNV